MKREVWNFHMRTTLRNYCMEMANLTELIVQLHQSTNEKYRKDKNSIDELDYLQQVNKLHAKLEDLRDQYQVFWENYEKRNRKYWGEKVGSENEGKNAISL